ncbi:hypothetical protein, partial [Shigella sonnei]|uniref:hypothetical protein n=1 Tax=Shigella sonnei TaxID=624 RepID=UPI00339124D7
GREINIQFFGSNSSGGHSCSQDAYLLMPFAHIVYRLPFFLCVIDLLIVYSMCNSVLSVHTALLYLGQVAVANENLFSTSLPG